MTTKIQFPGSKLETTQSIVNKITSTSSTGSVEIANYTKLSSNPRFLTKLSADQLLTNSLATVAFDTDVFDVGTNHSAGVFTVPVTGVYKFSAIIKINVIHATDNVESKVLFKVNSNVYNEIWVGGLSVVQSATNASWIASGSRILSLTAADTVEVQVVTDGTVTSVKVEADNSSFCGRLIST
jgi:hypothetical protein